MTLTTGTKLGPYKSFRHSARRLVEVYRARETRLKRDDTFKVLPSLKLFQGFQGHSGAS